MIAQSALKESSITIDDPLDTSKHILLPDHEFILHRGYKRTMWELSTCKMPFSSRNFRGSSTGYTPVSGNPTELDKNTRIHAVRATLGYPGWDIRLTNTVQL